MPEEGSPTGGGEGAAGSAQTAAPTQATPPSTVAAGGSQSDAAGSLAPDGKASIIGGETINGTQAPSAFVLSDGTFAPDWTTKLPEEMGEARKGFERYKSVTDIVKGLHNANQVIGRKGVILPTDKSTPEEISTYRKAMGVPETPDGYSETVKPEQESQVVQWNDEIAKSYFEIAHRHNIPPAALKALTELNLKQREFEAEAALNEIMENKQQGLMHLRQTWGTNFDRNLGLAQRAAQLTGVNPNSYGWRDPEVVKGFVRLASMMDEDKIVSPGTSLPAGAADLKARAKDIQSNPQNPEYRKYWDGDPDVQAKVRAWHKASS